MPYARPDSLPRIDTDAAAWSPVRRAVRGLHAEARRRRSGTGALPLSVGPLVAPVDVEGGDPLVALLRQLRVAVTRHVCALRAEGARPEQTLGQVKALVREVMAADGWLDPWAVQTLTSQVVAWSIAAYYDR